MNVYLAGPMRGIPKFNFPAFMEAAEVLRKQGHKVFNPAERDLDKYDESVLNSPTGNLGTAEKRGFNLREALAADLRYVCLKADAVVLLPGWEKSKGATAERATAEVLGLEIHLYEDMIKNG